jgi:hypothetical protein
MVGTNKSKISKKESADALEVFTAKANEDILALQAKCDEMTSKFQSVLKVSTDRS